MDSPTIPGETVPRPNTENKAAKNIMEFPTISRRTASHLSEGRNASYFGIYKMKARILKNCYFLPISNHAGVKTLLIKVNLLF